MPAAKRQKPSLPLLLLMAVILCGFIYAAYREAGSVSSPFVKDGGLQVHFIDVGQGDCSLIVFGETVVLVDAGERDKGAAVSEYLNGLGIKRLDYIIATHPHSDHIGGLPEVLGGFETGRILAPKVRGEMSPTTKVYEDFLLAVKARGMKLTAAKAGDRYALYSGYSPEDTALIEIVSPIEPQCDEYDDLNDYSVVFLLTYKNTSFLFTGDASKPAERDMLSSGAKLSADLLKAGHHGSSTASTKEFLAAVNPSVCVIQCGRGNSYNHPNAAALERLKQTGATVYRNDLDGNIIAYSDGERIEIYADN